MAANFDLKVLSPNRALATVKATAVTLPGTEGYMTILPEHASMVAELDIGEVIVAKTDGSSESYFVAGGYVEVENNNVTVLASVIEKLSEIDTARAQAARNRSAERLSKLQNDSDLERANLAMKRAEQRIMLAQTLASISKS